MRQDMQVLTSHSSKEWFTPPKYVELARFVMGSIDLDPASHPVAQEWINAGRYYTEAEDGLNREWFGNVWLNPPYGKEDGKSSQSVWSKKIVREYEAGNISSGILLVNSTHGYRWYEELWRRWPVCLLSDRISFIRPDRSSVGPAKRGQTFVYFGRDLRRFMFTFNQVGRVIPPDKLWSVYETESGARKYRS